MPYKHDQYPREAVVRFVKCFKSARLDFALSPKDLYFSDIGCGAGRHVELAHDEGFPAPNILAYDINEQQAPDWMDCRWLDIHHEPAQRADCVVCDGVLDHLYYDRFYVALDNLFASVAPGGWLFISLAESCPREYLDKLTFHKGCYEAKYVKGPEPGENQIFFQSGILDVVERGRAAGLEPTYCEKLIRRFGSPDYFNPEEWGRWFLWFERESE